MGGRKIVEMALGTIVGYAPSDEIREDYISCYDADRQAATDDHNRRETALYAQSLERKALARNQIPDSVPAHTYGTTD